MRLAFRGCKSWGVGAAAVLALFAHQPAQACIPEPPVHWSTVLSDNGPGIFLGRVDRLSLEAPRTWGNFEITEATANIRSLEVVQGAPAGAVQVTRMISVERLDPEGPFYCGDRLDLGIGDLVLVIERPRQPVRTVPSHETNPPEIQSLFARYQ